MFQKANKSSAIDSVSINLIGNGTSIVGDIISNGDIRIDGSLKGNITITGKLVVGSTGNIEGNVQCQNADVSGKINGKITVNELLSLKASAIILGDIAVDKIFIEIGAKFVGYMGTITKNQPDAREGSAKAV